MIATPFAVAVFVFSAAMFTLPHELSWVDVAWLQGASSTFWVRVGIGGTLAVLALILMSASAIAYNVSVYSDELSEWEQEVSRRLVALNDSGTSTVCNHGRNAAACSEATYGEISNARITIEYSCPFLIL